MAGGGGGGAGPQPKQDELQPHPSKDQLPNISYCITSPPPWRQSLSLSLFDIRRENLTLLKCTHPFWKKTAFVVL